MTSDARHSRYIAVEGPIGVGKTTLAKALCKHLQARLVLEEFDENPFLREFYKDKDRVAFQTQIYFLLTRFKQQEGVLQQDLFARAIVSDYLFAKDRIFAYLNLAEAEVQLYERIYELIQPRLLKPDLVVYLQARPEVLVERMQKRGREYEMAVDVKYLEDLQRAYNSFFFHYNETPLLVIDSSEIDIVNNPQDLQEIFNVIEKTQHGTQHYLPQKS
jgi:deoxyguanosine kinase